MELEERVKILETESPKLGAEVYALIVFAKALLRTHPDVAKLRREFDAVAELLVANSLVESRLDAAIALTENAVASWRRSIS
jgi:hypothetical protein